MDDENKINELPKRNYKSVEVGKSPNKENSVFLGEENLAKVQNFQKTFQIIKPTFKKVRNPSVDFHSTFVSENINNQRKYGMSPFKSSNSLQNSVYSWSFSKTGRFDGTYKKPISDSMYSIPDGKNMRFTTQGFGKRYELKNITGRSSPPPNTYSIKSCFDKSVEHRKGALMLEKVPPIAPTTLKYPGPGSYIPVKGQWNKDMQTVLKSRQNIFYDDDIKNSIHCISPQTYLPSTKIQQSHRFTKVTFGLGFRSPNINTSTRFVPGPGTYDLPSVFDTSRKYRVPLN